ncbi:MAG: hypothetical protein E7092_08370 [Bacteroidales bacterium]|nr:hypothetical protein [Bacteroidales bacterium]
MVTNAATSVTGNVIRKTPFPVAPTISGNQKASTTTSKRAATSPLKRFIL